jgi:peptidoglycan/LPS O-acetylase OafA/YrhL
MRLPTIIKRPSAFLPVAMSLAALVTVLVALAIGGVARETDEGTAAHIWQLLMGGQLPIMAYFAIRWLPQAPRQALYVLALQLAVALAALAPVYLLHL